MLVVEFGTVIDIRVHRGGGMSRIPFGFVVFDSEEPVKHLLRLQVTLLVITCTCNYTLTIIVNYKILVLGRY